jgi:hypothetical protein
MNMTKRVVYIMLSVLLGVLLSCSGPKSKRHGETTFTKIDSLTETYLTLQDSLLHAWNVMAWDEKDKIKAMHGILHMLQEQGDFDDQQLIALEQRLEQLDRIRFTQKSLANSYVIEEYDFASNSLVSEIVSLAEANIELIENEKVQVLVDKVKLAEQRVNDYRNDYDRIAERYNLFLERNEKYLNEIDADQNGQKRALFQMASE